MTDKIAIIGFGNIASAIVTPLLDNKLIQPENVFCVVNTEKSLEYIKKNYKHNINVYKSGSKESKIIWDCPYKLLSIKPQQLNDISEAHHIKNKDNLIVSILAGVSMNKLNTSELKNLVTSPGVTTISDLRVLEKKIVRSALMESIVSASNRSKEFR